MTYRPPKAFYTSCELAMSKDPNAYMDAKGFIGNINLVAGAYQFDGGDSLQRTGLVGALAGFVHGPSSPNGKLATMRLLERLKGHCVGKGLYVRHPDRAKWYSRLNTTTGDQLRPIIIALGLLGCHKEAGEIIWALAKRLGFYWNTRDTGEANQSKPKWPGFSGPEHWAVFIRASSKFTRAILYPMLLAFDAFGILPTMWAAVVYPRQKVKHADQLNRLLMLTQGVVVAPTPFSLLNKWLFQNLRPVYNLRIYKHSEAPNSLERFWQDCGPRHKQHLSLVSSELIPDVFTYIFDAYFWYYSDPPLQLLAYPVAKKYWQK